MSGTKSSEFLYYKKDEVVFCEGEHPNMAYVVNSGKVILYKNLPDGKLYPVDLLDEKNFIGDSSIFNGGKRDTTAVALTDLEVVPLKKNDITKVLKTSSEWVADIMNTISTRLTDSYELLAKVGVKDSTIEDLMIMDPGLIKRHEKSISTFKKDRGIS